MKIKILYAVRESLFSDFAIKNKKNKTVFFLTVRFTQEHQSAIAQSSILKT